MESATTSLVPLPVPPKGNPSLFFRIKCLCVFIFMFITTYFGSIFMQVSLLPLAFTFPALFKKYIDTTIYMWFKLVEFLLTCFLNVRVRLYGDEFLPNGPGQNANFLLLLNHRTRLDWMYTWLLGERLQSTKIVLKAILGAIPGAGWAMNLASFIFLQRKLKIDTVRIKQAAAYLTNVGEKVEIFIFPEGTDLDYHTLKKNQEYANKVGKPVTHYTLHPRVAGTQLLLDQFIPDDNIQYIYDATVAYPYEFPTHEPHVVLGHMPREVHFLVKRYPISQLSIEQGPDGKKRLNKDAFTKWLEEIWMDKEATLQKYYSVPENQRRFSAEEVPLKNVVYDWNTHTKSAEGIATFSYWIVFISVILYLTLTNTFMLVYFCFVNCVCTYIWYTKEGGIAGWISEIGGFPASIFEEPDVSSNNESTLNGNIPKFNKED